MNHINTPARLSRRKFLGTGAALVGGAFVLASCGDDDGGNSSTGNESSSLRFAWWGNPTRDELTRTALDVFSAETGIEVEDETTSFDSYGDRLNTQVAGGNPPDVMQMDPAVVAEYAGRDALVPLDDFVGNALDLSDFDERAMASAKVDGELYGLTMGINSVALLYNQSVLDAAGVELPDHTMTWAEFAELCTTIGENTPDDVFGTSNGLYVGDVTLGTWLRQQGKQYYTDEGQLGFEAADLATWFQYWADLVDAGAAVTGELEAAKTGDISDSFVATGQSAFQFFWSNQVAAVAGASDSEIGMLMFPQGDAPDAQPGQFYNPSMMLSVSSDADDPDAAVELLNALVLDTEIAGELGYERGVPPSATVRDAIADQVSEPERKMGDYIAFIADKVGDSPAAPPQGNTEVKTAYQAARDAVVFGQMSAEEGAAMFFDEATDALA